MKEFFKLNTYKLLTYFAVSVAMFIILFGSIAYMGYHYGQFSLKEFFVWALVIPVGFSLALSVTGPFLWISEQNKRKKALQTSPFNQLEEIGFKACYYHCQNWKSTTDRSLCLAINEFIVIFDAPGPDRKMPCALFTVLIKKKKLNKQERSNLQRELQSRTIKHFVLFERSQLSRIYPLKENIISLDQLKLELVDFVQFLKEAGFELDNDQIQLTEN